MRSKWAARWLWGAAGLAGLLAAVSLIGWAVLRIGGCSGGFGWSALHCARIPETLGGWAFGAAILGPFLAISARWLLVPVIFAPPLVLELLARRRDRRR